MNAAIFLKFSYKLVSALLLNQPEIRCLLITPLVFVVHFNSGIPPSLELYPTFVLQGRTELKMLIYAAVKKYRSKQEKDRESRERTQQSGQSVFNTSSQPSYMTRTTQATSQVGLSIYRSS